jgi:hypothetical protein
MNIKTICLGLTASTLIALGFLPSVMAVTATLTANDPNSRINVHTGPSIESPFPQYGLPGDPVEILRQTKGKDGYTWYYVKFKVSGAKGWVRQDLINLSSSPNSSSPQNHNNRQSTANSQQIWTYPKFKLINQKNKLELFNNMLPRRLPAGFEKGKVVIVEFGNFCDAYVIAKEGVNLTRLPLIPFRRYPTMDVYGVVGNSFPPLSNYAALEEGLPQKLYNSGSLIYVRGCGGRVDGPELRSSIKDAKRAELPDRRKAFFLKSNEFRWKPSWCVFEKESESQSAFICVGVANSPKTALEVLKSIVSK